MLKAQNHFSFGTEALISLWLTTLGWLVELMFLETSALMREKVKEAFLKCARIILNKIEAGEDAVLGGFWEVLGQGEPSGVLAWVVGSPVEVWGP